MNDSTEYDENDNEPVIGRLMMHRLADVGTPAMGADPKGNYAVVKLDENGVLLVRVVKPGEDGYETATPVRVVEDE